MQEFHPNDITVQLYKVNGAWEVYREKNWTHTKEHEERLIPHCQEGFYLYQLIYIMEGNYWHQMESQKKRLIPEGSLSLIRIDEQKFVNTSCDLPLRYLALDFESREPIPLPLPATERMITVQPDPDAALEPRFRAVLEILQQRPFGWKMRLTNVVTEILLSFFSEFYASEIPDNSPKLLEKSIDIIRQSIFTDPLTVNDVADRCGISTAYLIRIFNRFMGVTPKKYMDEIRLNRACDLLKYTDQSIEQVASLSGFAEPRHLRRALEARTGLTPREYRRQM